MLPTQPRESRSLARALDRLARDVLAHLEACGGHLHEVHICAPSQEEAVRVGLRARLTDFGIDGADIRVHPGDYALLDCKYEAGDPKERPGAPT